MAAHAGYQVRFPNIHPTQEFPPQPTRPAMDSKLLQLILRHSVVDGADQETAFPSKAGTDYVRHMAMYYGGPDLIQALAQQRSVTRAVGQQVSLPERQVVDVHSISSRP